MPEWLRSLQSNATARPAPMPGQMPGQMPGAAPPRGPGAPNPPNPPWGMPQIPASAPPPGQPGGFGGSPFDGPPGGYQGGSPAGQSLSVSSLISNDALPDWIRAAPSPTPMPTAPWGSQPAAGAVPWGVTPPPMGQSSALFDDAALPDWLRAAAAGQAPAGDPANGGGYAPTPPSASPLAGAYNGRMALPPSPYDPPGAPSPFQSAPQPPANGYGNGYANGYGNGYGNGPANAPAMSAGPSLFDAAALP
ncbi:MAG TPA: hypothetical protein VIG30_19400, partial [Ktedonobacterales bacterium]